MGHWVGIWMFAAFLLGLPAWAAPSAEDIAEPDARPEISVAQPIEDLPVDEPLDEDDADDAEDVTPPSDIDVATPSPSAPDVLPPPSEEELQEELNTLDAVDDIAGAAADAASDAGSAAEAAEVPDEVERYTEAPGFTMSLLYRGISLFGVFGFIGIGWLVSEKRGMVQWRPVLWGIGLQLIFGVLVLGLGLGEYIHFVVDYLVNALLGFSNQGAAFVFASFMPHQISTIGPNGFEEVTYGFSTNDLDNWSPGTKNVAFFVLPTIIFFSALLSLFYYLGLMTPIVKGIAWLMMRTLGTSGSESLSAAGNIFVGQTEAPLLVKPFVPTMTRSELMAVMTGGFATVAGGVLGVYVMLLRPALPDIAGHLVVASILSAPAALAMAKVMVPETEESVTAGKVKLDVEQTATNFIEAAANGAIEGLKLVLNVVAMLIAIVALVAMLDWVISWVPVGQCGDAWTVGYSCGVGEGGAMIPTDPIGMSDILGIAFFPASALMGVPVQDWFVVGQLLGEKIVLTELIAYKSLAGLVDGTEVVMTERSAIIASYALCGFANFASIGIQLGGIGGLAPSRMGELASLGFRAMFAGALAACMTGAVAGIFL